MAVTSTSAPVGVDGFRMAAAALGILGGLAGLWIAGFGITLSFGTAPEWQVTTIKALLWIAPALGVAGGGLALVAPKPAAPLLVLSAFGWLLVGTKFSAGVSIFMWAPIVLCGVAALVALLARRPADAVGAGEGGSLDQLIGQRQLTWYGHLMNSQAFWVFVAIVVACIYLSFAARNGAFTTPQNLYNITRNFTFTAIIALGMTFVIILGGIDLSVGSVLCLSSMVLAVVMHNWGASLELGIAVAITVALAVGAFNGILIAYLGFPPFVVTLGMLSIARSIAMTISSNTTVFQFGPDHARLLWLGGGATFGIANPVWYMIVLALITGFVLRWTRFGRYVFAIGGNEHAATLSGIPVRPMKVAVYMISALTAGIAGIVQTGWLGAVTTNIGSGLELQVIAAAVIGGASLIGGAGTAVGALVGAALIEVIRNSLGLLGINAFWQGTVIGSCIIIAVAFERVRSLRSTE